MRFLLDVAIIACVLLLPGMAVARAWFHAPLQKWSRPFRLVTCVLLSLCVVFLAAFALGRLPLPLAWKRAIAWALVTGSAVFLVVCRLRSGRRVAAEGDGKAPWFLYGGCAALLAIWVSCVPLLRYPGVASFGMGDVPEYYCLARNIASGRGFVVDYFIGDFWTGPKVSLDDVVGSRPTAARRPLVPYVTSFLFYLTGTNVYAIHVAASMLGCLLPLSFYGLMVPRLRRMGLWTAGRDRFCEFAALGLCLVPTHFMLFGLGTVTLFELLPWLTLWLLAELREWKLGVATLVMALAAGLATVSRPEGIVLVFGLFLVYFVPAAARAAVQRRLREVVAAPLAIACGVAVLNVPVLFVDYGPGAGVHYHTLDYDASYDAFIPRYTSWPEVNSSKIHENFSEHPRLSTLINKGVGAEIRAHPAAFGRWWLVQLKRKTLSFLRFYGEHEKMSTYGRGEAIGFAVVVAAAAGPGWRIVAILALYLLGYSLLTPALWLRHAAVMSPPILSAVFLTAVALPRRVLAWPSVARAWTGSPTAAGRRWGRAHGANVLTVLAAAGFLAIMAGCTAGLVAMIGHPANRQWEPAIRMVRAHTKPSSVVVVDNPDLMNLMTGRVALGASELLDILNPRLERFRPDYVVINNYRPGLESWKFTAKARRAPWLHIAATYQKVAEDPETSTILFKHNPRQ